MEKGNGGGKGGERSSFCCFFQHQRGMLFAAASLFVRPPSRPCCGTTCILQASFLEGIVTPTLHLQTQCVLRGLFAETCKVHFRSLQVTWKILQRHDPRPWEIEIQNLLLLCYYLLHCKPVHLDDCVVTNNF